MLVDNTDKTDCPAFIDLIAGVDRSTWEGRFSSRFRSNRTPLPDHVAREMVRVAAHWEHAASISTLATSYEEALPYRPPSVDRARKRT